MIEVVIICCLATLFGIICWGIGSSLYKLIMGEWFLAVNDSHRIAYKRGKFYPQHKHTWERFWHHYKDTRISKDGSGEWQSKRHGKLCFNSSEEARAFLSKLAWYN